MSVDIRIGNKILRGRKFSDDEGSEITLVNFILRKKQKKILEELMKSSM